MAEAQKTYVVPLREAWRNKSSYKRTRAAVQEVKRYVARHMKVPGRDLDLVSIDVHLNNELWHRGSSSPPARIEVKAHKEKELVIVTLANEPEHLKFAKDRHVMRHKKGETTKTKPVEQKTEEEKKEEQEKEKSVAVANEKLAEANARAIKHTTKVKQPKINRMALQK